MRQRALCDGWRANKARAKDSWLLMLVGALGDERLLAPLHHEVERRDERAATIALKALTGLAGLAAQGYDAAANALDELAEHARSPRVRERARTCANVHAPFMMRSHKQHLP